MYNYPERKTTRYRIPTKNGEIAFMVKQASARETLELSKIEQNIQESIEKKDKSVVYWQTQLAKYWMGKLDETHEKGSLFSNWFIKRRLKLVKESFFNYIEDFKKIIHPLRGSKYTNTKQARPTGAREWVFDGSLSVMAKELNCRVDQVYDIVTYEQLSFIYDKITYDNYESFDDWKIQNSKVRGKLYEESGKIDAILKLMWRK